MFLREPTDGHMVRMTGIGLYCAQYSTFSAKINDLRPIPDLYGDQSVISPSTGLNRQALFGSDRVWIRSEPDPTAVSARYRGRESVAGTGFLGKIFRELAFDAFEFLCVGVLVLFLGDVGPALGVFGVDLEPLLQPRLGVRLDRV